MQLCEAIGRPDVAADPETATLAQRIVHFDELDDVLRAAIATRTVADWEADLRAREISVGPVLTPQEALQDPLMRSLGLLGDEDLPSLPLPLGGIPTIRHESARRRRRRQLGPGGRLAGGGARPCLPVDRKLGRRIAVSGPPRPPVDRSAACLKVLDVGTIVAGPFTASILGDLGAEVIKVERPDGGDTLRHVRTGRPGMSNQWLVEGRNKRSVTLNLRERRGQLLIEQLACWADILVENFQPGTMAKWGLAYEDLRKLNPRLVYVSVSGYGQTGPKAALPGFDPAAVAYSSLTYVTGYPDRPPVSPGYPVADYFCGTFAAVGALEALRRRDVGTGEGEWVDCALYAPLVRVSADIISHYAAEGVIRDREGGMPGASPQPNNITWACVYQTLDDKWISLTALPDFIWSRLAELLDRPDLLANDELRTSIGRRNNVHTLDATIREWVAGRTQAEALDELTKRDLPHSPVNSVADIATDPHLRARGDIIDMTGDDGRTITVQGVVPTLVNQPGAVRWLGEELGASNQAVYEHLLGLSANDLAELRSDGIV